MTQCFVVTMQCLYLILLLVPAYNTEGNANGLWKNSISPVDPCTDKNHFFLAPGVLTAGSINRACISRFYPDGPANVLLTLHAEGNQTATAARELAPGDGGCLDIAVPLLPNTKAELIVNIRYPGICSWERKLELRIASGRVVAVHTERARYRPGETMRARVFALKADLTPAHATIEEIWLEGPPGAWEGTRIAEWMKVRSKMGLAQIQHDIDEQAPAGLWSIRARLADGSQGSAEFLVGDYDLPPFQLTVRHAPRVLRTSERLVWTVCVRYPWSEAVSGMLVVRLRAGPMGSLGGVRTALRLKSSLSCHRHAAAASRLGLNHETNPELLIAHFSFQEEGTRVWQNTTVVSQIVDKPISLQFLTKPKTVLSPGLPYKLKVKATRFDDKPAPNERIKICRTTGNTNQICAVGDSDVTGVARIMFHAEDNAAPVYTFVATLANDSTVTTGPLTLATRNSKYQAALGPLRVDPNGARTFVPLYLGLQNASIPVTVHFVVITRGGIIYRWGATTQCPIASSYPNIQVARRNTKCDSLPQYDDNKTYYDHNFDKNNNRIGENSRKFDENSNNLEEKLHNLVKNGINSDENRAKPAKNAVNFDKNKYYDAIKHKFERIKTENGEKHDNDTVYDANESDALLDRHLLRIMLPIKVTQQMCPDSHLIAYFYYNGEFVSASKHFEMDDCFLRVSASFSPRQVPPSSPASLVVHSPSPAVCALSALDTTVRRTPQALAQLMLHSLKKLMTAHRNLTEYDAAGDCFFTEETIEPPLGSTELTATWLAAAGVRTVGDLPPRRQCAAAALHQTTPRTDFSEAWLWRIVTVNSSGIASSTATTPDSITRFEANAVCISKTGIGISQPAILQVFREFFIHADGPRRLRRGDSAIYRYRIFNYLYKPLSVQVQILSDSLQTGSSQVEVICVSGRGAAGRRVVVVAGRAGGAVLRLRARTVRDNSCGTSEDVPHVSDEVEIKIKVDPEGFPVNEQKSILLCGSDNDLSSKSEVNWSWSPIQAVPRTETLTVWAVGDIAGPIVGDGGQLVPLPLGCGEQNMARVAYNLLALSRLHPACSHAQISRVHLARGLTRQLQFVHRSGGFSAFASDSSPSTWLTAFCLKYLKRAHEVLWPNKPIPPAIVRAEKWLLAQQMENGCFRNEGQVFHRELRGGLNEEGEIASVALTAYVITSLLESTSTIPPRVIENTLSCLRALSLKYQQNRGYGTSSRIYAHSLLAYAFMRLKKYEEDLRGTNEVGLKKDGLKEHEGVLEVMELIKMANRENDFMWWETSSLPTTIEATGYALLALKGSPSLLHKYGAGAVRWLTTHRGPGQGFLSTQDTLVALEALSAWSSLQPTSANLTVTAKVDNKLTSVHVTTDEKIPEHFRLEGRNVTIGVKGTGCALIQATRTYNTLVPPRTDNRRLSVQLSVNTDGTFDCDAELNCYCAAVVEACVLWSGGFPDMALLEISLPGGYGADSTKLYDQLQQPNTLIRRIELGPGGGVATLYLTSRAAHTARGHACFPIHAVGPSTRTKPAYVRVMDYYTPTVNDTQVYTVPEDCPSRVTHDTSQDITDNLYNKARSMDDEILITHEFTFEDIPEGIPLEDPLYDNLRKTPENVAHIEDIRHLNEERDKPKTAVVTSRKDFTLEEGHHNENLRNTLVKINHHSRHFDVDQNVPRALFSNFENRDKNKSAKSKISRNLDDKLDRLIFPDGKLDLGTSEDEAKKLRDSTTDRIVILINATDETKSHESFKQGSDFKKDVNTDDKQKYSNITLNNQNNYKVENSSIKVDNPSLSDFHIIDSDVDLDVPTGIEGPVPSIVLPPKDFVPPPQNPSLFIPPPVNNITTPSDLFFSFKDVPSSIYTPLNFASPPANFASPPSNFVSPQPNYASSSSKLVSPSPNLASPLKNFASSPTNFTLPSKLVSPPTNFTSPPSKFLSLPTNFASPRPNFASPPTSFASPSSKFVSPSSSLTSPPKNFAPPSKLASPLRTFASRPSHFVSPPTNFGSPPTKFVSPPPTFLSPFPTLSKELQPPSKFVRLPLNFAPLEHWQTYEEYLNFGPSYFMRPGRHNKG